MKERNVFPGLEDSGVHKLLAALPMSSTPELVIKVGHDLTLSKYYSLATCTVLFYDFLLTFADETKHAWSRKKSWAFWLFFINRYLPMTAEIWFIFAIAGPPLPLGAKICERTAWYPIFVFVVCTLLAQVVLTVRICAVTTKNIPITVGFAIITACQFGLGVFLVTFAVRRGAQPLPPIPIEAYHFCAFVRHRTLEVVYTSVSLFYDLLAFLLIVALAKGSQGGGVKIPTILLTIAQDATRYFLIIFASHFVLVMTLGLAPETIQLLPAPFLSVMVSRLILSLRKAADPCSRSPCEPSANGTNLQTLEFIRPPEATTFGGETRFDIHPGSLMEVQ